MLVGSEQALPIPRSTDPDPRVIRFNRLAAKRFVRQGNLNTGMALVASGTGAPLPCPMLDVFIAARLEEEQAPDPAFWAAMLGAGHPAAGAATRVHRAANCRACAHLASARRVGYQPFSRTLIPALRSLARIAPTVPSGSESACGASSEPPDTGQIPGGQEYREVSFTPATLWVPAATTILRD
jgi:hypothetical protein